MAALLISHQCDQTRPICGRCLRDGTECRRRSLSIIRPPSLIPRIDLSRYLNTGTSSDLVPEPGSQKEQPRLQSGINEPDPRLSQLPSCNPPYLSQYDPDRLNLPQPQVQDSFQPPPPSDGKTNEVLSSALDLANSSTCLPAPPTDSGYGSASTEKSRGGRVYVMEDPDQGAEIDFILLTICQLVTIDNICFRST